MCNRKKYVKNIVELAEMLKSNQGKVFYSFFLLPWGAVSGSDQDTQVQKIYLLTLYDIIYKKQVNK